MILFIVISKLLRLLIGSLGRARSPFSAWFLLLSINSICGRVSNIISATHLLLMKLTSIIWRIALQNAIARLSTGCSLSWNSCSLLLSSLYLLMLLLLLLLWLTIIAIFFCVIVWTQRFVGLSIHVSITLKHILGWGLSLRVICWSEFLWKSVKLLCLGELQLLVTFDSFRC